MLTEREKYQIQEHIKLSFREDFSDEEDHSSKSSFPEETQASAVLISKDSGIIAGLEVAEMVFHFLDPELKFSSLISDGTQIEPRMRLFELQGRASRILSGERLALNYLQRMSGIATKTAEYVKAVEGTGAKILDTRKTSPGLRLFEKLAVKIGGGLNHRHGLYDMIMLKDNHIDYAGGIKAALDSCYSYKEKQGVDVPVEIETRSLSEVQEVLNDGRIDRIMLDNFSPEETRQAVDLIDSKIETESSGGITLSNVRSYAECGVNYVSIGALTHHIKSLDLSLKASIS